MTRDERKDLKKLAKSLPTLRWDKLETIGTMTKKGDELKAMMLAKSASTVVTSRGEMDISQIKDDIEYELPKLVSKPQFTGRKQIEKELFDLVKQVEKRGQKYTENAIRDFVEGHYQVYKGLLVKYPKYYHEQDWKDYDRTGKGFSKAVLSTLRYNVQNAIS